MMTQISRRLCGPVVLALLLAGLMAPVPGHGQLGPVVPAPEEAVPLQIAVTGMPAPATMLELALLTTIRAQIPGARDDRLTLLTTTPPLTELPSFSTHAVEASVGMASPGQPPATHVVHAVFVNAVMPWSDAQALLVSNSPETLPFGKVLFSGILKTSQTVRLLYHHQNGSKTQHMVIAVTLSNPTLSPITLWLSGAQSAGGGDELGLGHQAARAFLDAYRTRAGFLLRVPPNTTLPFLVHDLAPSAIGSGVAQIQLSDGARLNLQVTARLNGEGDPPVVSYTPNFDKAHQRGVFLRPQITRSLTFTIGGPPATMALGVDADLIRADETGQMLQGNYGVMYAFGVQVANPTADPATAALVMHADGGVARGTFLIDDTLIDSPPVQPNQPRVLTTIKLDPGSRRLVRIATMPESGSNYPVRLTLGPP